MESQTQTVTEPPVSNIVDSGGKTEPNIDVNSGPSFQNLELPGPKTKPQEVKEPKDEKSLENGMATDEEREKNEKEWEAYNETEWARYLAFKKEVESVDPNGFTKDGEDDEGEPGSRNILAGMSFQNGHQVNQLLLDQLRIVLETDADRTKRDEGYKCRCFPDFII